MKRKKKTPFRKLYKETWKYMSIWVRLRDKGVCFTCGKVGDWKEMNAGHFVHCNSMDFEPIENVHCQCPRCNMYLSGNLGEYAVRLDKVYGDGTAENLLSMKHRIVKYSRQRLEEIQEDLKNKIALLMTDKVGEAIQ